MTQPNKDKGKRPATTSRYFTRGRKLRRTDEDQDYLAAASTSTINIESDGEEEARLNREISDLYQQIKLKKERIERIRINRAVQEALAKQRRETRKWLPALSEVEKCRDSIIRNLSGEDDTNDDTLMDSDSDDSSTDYDDLTLPSVSDIFEDIFGKDKNKFKKFDVKSNNQ